MNNSNITQLLNQIPNGDEFVLEKTLKLIYDELKIISSKYLRNEYRLHTLQTTELVHEAYIKLVGNQNLTWESRAHFYGIVVKSIRQILVDYARKRKAIKRGSGQTMISLDDAGLTLGDSDDQILNLDHALKNLEEHDKRAYEIVELRFFSGLSIEETAEILNISPATVKRDWNFAKAWLYREMN